MCHLGSMVQSFGPGDRGPIRTSSLGYLYGARSYGHLLSLWIGRMEIIENILSSADATEECFPEVARHPSFRVDLDLGS